MSGIAGTRQTGRWPAQGRRLSPDEAEAVLAGHFLPGVVEAQIRSGSYVVRWWPAGEDPDDGEQMAESSESFEAAIRELARRRPELVRQALDAPDGLLARLRAPAEPHCAA